MSVTQHEIRTERLLLRKWSVADREPFAALNADPVVTRYLSKTRSREESDALADKIESHFDTHGFGFWAVEVPDVAAFTGFVGLAVTPFESHFTPCVEIGWRLAAEHWGQGYATEAARGALEFGFDTLGLDEIVAFTVPGNAASRRVMEKIGMRYNPADDFDYPLLPAEHPHSRHVLYRISPPGSDG